MQQRLLDGYLAGGLGKDVFTAKSTEFKIQSEGLRELEKENARLKRLLAERDVEIDVMRGIGPTTVG